MILLDVNRCAKTGGEGRWVVGAEERSACPSEADDGVLQDHGPHGSLSATRRSHQ
jgi:hypothetical protein